ncbi:MAG: hypothetical protein ACM31F_07185 [Gemmatimonas sp.]
MEIVSSLWSIGRYSRYATIALKLLEPMTEKPDFTDWRFRLLVAISIGGIAAAYCLSQMKTIQTGGADDFTWHWLGARALLKGQSPYKVVTAGGKYNLIAPYIYPLTTSIAAIPFSAFLPPPYAATLFIGLSTTLLAWGLIKDDYHRLPLFLSLPFAWSASSGQFAPIVAAAALIPALGWLAPIKPTIGLAAVAYRPSKAAVIGSAAFLGVAFVFNPHWVSEWHDSLAHRVRDVYWAPVTVMGGPLLLLALFKWKRPEARMLVVLSLVPQLFLFYDQLLLWLVPKTWRESLLLSVLSWVALYFGNKGFGANPSTQQVVSSYAMPMMFLLFLPSLVMVLRRPNRGSLPTWLTAIRSRSHDALQRIGI